MNFYPLVVESIRSLTSKSIQVRLSVPEEYKTIFTWNPGQFIRLKFEIDGQSVEREYSICTAPYEGQISFAVKETFNPFISKYIGDTLKVGDLLLASAPMGNFGIPSRPHEKRTLVAFSAGSGITPIMSIIKDTLHKEEGVNLFLFFGNAHEREVMFKKDLDQLQEQYPDNFFPHYFYSEQETEDKLYEGMLDDHKVKLIINQIMDWDEVDEVLICGPKDMIITLANAVYKNGIPKENIHYEMYEPVEKVFYDDEVQRSTVKEVEVTVTYEGDTYTINWINNGNSLLEALLDSGIDAPYSCKGGVCGTCQCKKVEGDVILGENLVLTDDDIQNGRMLTCVAQPKTDKLIINLDEQ